MAGQHTLESILALPQVPRVEVVQPQAFPNLNSQPSVNAAAAAPAPIERTADLKRLKRAVARLPGNHPLRLSLEGEPDAMPRAELLMKLREWAKFFAWSER